LIQFDGQDMDQSKSDMPYMLASKINLDVFAKVNLDTMIDADGVGVNEARFKKVFGSSGKWMDEYNFFRNHTQLVIGAQVAVIIQDMWSVSGVYFSAQNISLMKTVEGTSNEVPLKKNSNFSGLYNGIILPPELKAWGGQ
jgi:hypothetical protein